MLRLKTKLKQSVLELTAQADEFLEKHLFVVDDAHRKLFASYVQMIPPNKDYFYQHEAAAYMRKAITNEAAFFVMHPKKYEEYLALKSAAEKKAADEASQAAPTPLEQKA